MKKIKRTCFYGLSLGMLCLLSFGCATKKWGDEVHRLQQENATLQAQVSSLSMENNALKSQMQTSTVSPQPTSGENETAWPKELSPAARKTGHSSWKPSNLKELRSEGFKIIKKENGVAIELSNAILFAPGQATLSQEGIRKVEKVGSLIKKRFSGASILVEGYTDNVQPRRSAKRFKSNLELSEARAEAVRDILVRKADLPAEQVQIKGYGESQPIASNKTEAGRRRNRRVNVVILNSRF